MIGIGNILKSGHRSAKISALEDWLIKHVELRYCKEVDYDDVKKALSLSVKRLNRTHGGVPLTVVFNDPTEFFRHGEIIIRRGERQEIFIVRVYRLCKYAYSIQEGGAEG